MQNRVRKCILGTRKKMKLAPYLYPKSGIKLKAVSCTTNITFGFLYLAYFLEITPGYAGSLKVPKEPFEIVGVIVCTGRMPFLSATQQRQYTQGTGQ